MIHEDLKGRFFEYGDYCIYNNIFGDEQSSSDPDYDLISNNGYIILKCNKVENEINKDDMRYLKCFNGASFIEDFYDYEDHKCLSSCSKK